MKTIGIKVLFTAMIAALAGAQLARGQAAALSTDVQVGVKLVYHNDFSAPVGSEWSQRWRARTPKDQRNFLGRFVEEPVTLTLRELPKHQLLRVTFDLFLMRCWDGSSKTWGEKIWDCSVVDGPTLIHSTFSTAGFFSDNNVQSFPDLFPCKPYPAWTGATERQTLGFIQSFGAGPNRTFDADAVYHFSLTFPHDAPHVMLRFTSIMKGDKHKNWGLANVKVQTLEHFTPRDPKVLATLWDQLAGKDPIQAFAATWALIQCGDQAVEIMQTPHAFAVDEKAIAKLIADLDSDDFQLRQNASMALAEQRAAILPQLRKAYDAATSGEVRSRLDDIIKSTANDTNGDELRRTRMAHVLDVINTPAARRMRATLGVPAESK